MDSGALTTKWWLTDNNGAGALYGQPGILHNPLIWRAFKGTMFSRCLLCSDRRYDRHPDRLCSIQEPEKQVGELRQRCGIPAVPDAIPGSGRSFFILFSNDKINLFNTYTLLIIAGVIKYIPFASRSALNSMLQLSGEIEEAAIIQDIPWYKRMLRIIIPIQKSSIINGYMLPFMTCLRELSLFLLLCTQGFILSTTLDYFDEMGLYAFSSAINLILIVTILIFNTLVNKLTGPAWMKVSEVNNYAGNQINTCYKTLGKILCGR